MKISDGTLFSEPRPVILKRVKKFMPDLLCKLIAVLITQSAFTCLKLAIETLEQGVKCVQS